MGMDFGLYQQQTMKLAMTTELRQAIAILQYSTQELLSYIEEQQLENPLLELKEEKDKDKELPLSSSDYQVDHTDDWKNYEGDNVSPFDFLTKTEMSLQDHLLNQVGLLKLSEKEKKIVTYLIFSLDENGYFHYDLAEVAMSCLVSEQEAIDGLRIVQSLEPSGVGARSLQECLLIQLRKLPRRDDQAEKVVEEYLELLANKKWKEIAKNLAVSIEDVQSIADFIQTLQPKPGSSFIAELPTYISPDVTIEMNDDELIVSVNDTVLPKVSISRQYRDIIKKANDEASVKYVEQKHQQIVWLLKSIEQRQQTLLKVTESIAKYQEDFFKYGNEYFKPLTLKEVAADIDMHESTVSRATTQKFVQTPRGVFELKHFFSSKVKGEGGTSASSLSVKELIKKIVDQEKKQKPLSDQKIVSILEEDFSIEISRRTVAKYRDELNIPSSSRRKRF